MTFSSHFAPHTQTFWFWGTSTFTWTHSPANWLLNLNRFWTASTSTNLLLDPPTLRATHWTWSSQIPSTSQTFTSRTSAFQTIMQSPSGPLPPHQTTTHSILDFHAPLKTRTVTFTRSAPWFTEELRLLKRTGRVLEWAYVTSGLTVHKLAYREHRRRYAKELSKARSAHYSNIINNNPGNSKQLFTTVKHLLKPQTSPHHNQTVTQCNKFMDFLPPKYTISVHLSPPPTVLSHQVTSHPPHNTCLNSPPQCSRRSKK